jgi:hypothetical protein
MPSARYNDTRASARKRRRARAFGVGLLLCLSLLPVAEARSQSETDVECRSTIAKAVRLYTDAVLKTTQRCLKKRSAGKLPLQTDCTSVATADPKDRLERKRDKLRRLVAAPTGACSNAPAVLAGYPRCPSPGATADDGGGSDGIDDITELAECFIAVTEGFVAPLGADIAGRNGVRLAGRARRCQHSLAKSTRKLFKTFFKERSRCQRDLDESGGGLTYGCDLDDARGRIERERERFETAVIKACNFDGDAQLDSREELDLVGGCADDVPSLVECAVSEMAMSAGAGLVAMTYGFPSECRVGNVTRITNAGFGVNITASSFSGGYNGIGHDIDLTDRFRDVMTLDCDDDCAVCALGTDPIKDAPDAYCRCAADPTLTCDSVNAADADDCPSGNDLCRCFLGPPVAVGAGGAPACIQVRFDEAHEGTLDLGRGDWQNRLRLSAVMHLGLNLYSPCPTCIDDPVPNDGVRGGTCDGGARDGQACDVATFHRTFGPSSYDCPPRAATNISGTGLQLDIVVATGPASLAATLPCDGGGLCPCRVCSGDSTLGCSDDEACAAAGVGTCTGGRNVRANACNDGICGEDGVCTNGPTDRYCDGTTYADGRGYFSCATDLDCGVIGGGTCSIQEKRRCYPDPIVTDGAPGFYGGIASTVGCLGLTSSPVINAATGLPGAARVVFDFDAETRCADRPDLLFEPPTGFNCTATTTTSTTTSSLPPLPCIASFPTCGGACPAGQQCTTDPQSGVACVCLPTSTTTLPATACGDSVPLCNGVCPGTDVCGLDLLGLGCSCAPAP